MKLRPKLMNVKDLYVQLKWKMNGRKETIMKEGIMKGKMQIQARRVGIDGRGTVLYEAPCVWWHRVQAWGP